MEQAAGSGTTATERVKNILDSIFEGMPSARGNVDGFMASISEPGLTEECLKELACVMLKSLGQDGKVDELLASHYMKALLLP